MVKKLLILIITAGLVYSQSKFEIGVSMGYSNPLLEAYGDKVIIDTRENIYIDGKRLIVSDNFGTNVGYNVQAFLKYNFTKKGYVKGLFSLGYNILYGVYPGPGEYDCGIRVQSFSAGTGLEINPLGHMNKFYPSVYSLFRLNMLGGESYYMAGLDFFIVTPRFGYNGGINLNYRIKKNLALFIGYAYSYDNAMNRQSVETYDTLRLVIPFKDKYSATNGLTHDRRVAYWSLNLGMNYSFK